jgi:hypothetical protein
MKMHLDRPFCAVIIAVAIALICATPVFSQEKAPEKAPATPAPAAPATQAAAPAPSKDVPIYGEVQSVNATANSMTVLYYDEETYEEKSVDLLVDKDTKLENAKALADIKEGDWVDATYTAAEGKNKASSVKVEKEEELPPATTAPAADTGTE